MAAGKTIAVLGATEKTGIDMATKLAQENDLFLVVADDSIQLTSLSEHIHTAILKAEVEIVNCVRESCWEADLIILTTPPAEINEVIKKIKEVATQKIVVSFSDNEGDGSFAFIKGQELQQLLPYSKVVTAITNPYSLEIFIAGDNNEAVEIISNRMKRAGYQSVITESLSAIKLL